MKKLLVALTMILSVAVADEVLLETNNGDLIVCIDHQLFIKTTIPSGKVMYLPFLREDDTIESCYIDEEYLYDLAEYGEEL